MIDLSYKPTIIGEKIILRPFNSNDFESIEECLSDDEVIKFTGTLGSYDRDFTINWYNTRNEQVNRLDLAIVDKLTNLVIGEVVANEYDGLNHSMNFRIMIGPKGRNRGLGTEATSLFCDYLFSNTDLKQLTLGVYAFNPRGKRVYEKVGFIIDNIEKDELDYNGEKIDLINMILTRNRWENFSKIL